MILTKYSSEIILILTGFILLISMEILILTTNLKRSIFIFEILFFLPFFTYLLAIFLFRRENSGFSRNTLLIIIGFAIVFQIIILSTNVSLSDDIYRFFYEGKGLVNGVNPYLTPIEEFPDNLKDQYYEKVNNANVPSPYPPLTIFLFAILYLVFPNPFIFRICFSFCFLVSMLVSYKLISPQAKWKLIIYAWNPILHIETANGSHFDAIVILMIAISLWYMNSERFSRAGFFLVLGFLLKYYPIFLVFAFWKQLGKRGLAIIFAGVISYSLFVFLNPSLIQGLLIYSDDWYFNASVFWILYEIINNFLLSKILVVIVFTSILSIIVIRPQIECNTTYRYAIIIIGSFLLLQPVFHPWYFFWLFPFLILDDRMNLSWIILSGTLILSYHVYGLYDTVGIWVESNLFRVVEYIPYYIILIFEIWGINIINKKFSPLKLSTTSKRLSSLKKLVGIKNDRYETS